MQRCRGLLFLCSVLWWYTSNSAIRADSIRGGGGGVAGAATGQATTDPSRVSVRPLKSHQSKAVFNDEVSVDSNHGPSLEETRLLQSSPVGAVPSPSTSALKRPATVRSSNTTVSLQSNSPVATPVGNNSNAAVAVAAPTMGTTVMTIPIAPTSSPSLASSSLSFNSTALDDEVDAPTAAPSPSTPPPPPKKPLENDCPFDVHGDGQPSLDMSSSSVTVMLVTPKNVALVIPPPDTSAFNNKGRNDEAGGDKENDESMTSSTSTDGTAGSSNSSKASESTSSASTSSLLLPSSSIVCTFPQYGDLSFRQNGTQLMYEPTPDFVGTDTLVVQRLCQKRLMRKDPFGAPGRRRPPSALQDFEENEPNSTLGNPDFYNNTNHTIVFCIIEFLSIKVVEGVDDNSTIVPLSKASKTPDPTTVMVSSIAGVVALILAAIAALVYCNRRNQQTLHKVADADNTPTAPGLAHYAANNPGSTSTPSASSQEVRMEQAMQSQRPNVPTFYGHAPPDVIVERSLAPSPIMSPPQSASLSSESMPSSTLSSFDARATVMAVDYDDHVIALPLFKDQMRSMIQDGGNNWSSQHDNRDNARRASYQSNGTFAPDPPPNQTLQEQLETENEDYQRAMNAEVYLSEKDENVQTAAAAATATTAILMPTATAVPMPETQNHINERSSGNDTTDDDESVR